MTMKDQRRRLERGGGGEWEPIKISQRNLSYIPSHYIAVAKLLALSPPSVEG
jgi:hypothetical protein